MRKVNPMCKLDATYHEFGSIHVFLNLNLFHTERILSDPINSNKHYILVTKVACKSEPNAHNLQGVIMCVGGTIEVLELEMGAKIFKRVRL